ncbi:DeoR/GlpR family DNA-binding transcription regulator [Enterococcus sp. AZ192]|uniref:DeoR/GlpR family DNA-binding transcription regulator n=1 Tax=unclassified Enterococcus TaxID=2608891 RepID=UPI003D2C8ECD
MLMEERLVKIKEHIDEHKSATIEQLADKLHVSKDTIRRDLIKLEQQNVIRRTHGGAIAANREALILNYEERSSKFTIIKEKIAQKAAMLIKDNTSVLFDSSTTIEAVIRELSNQTMYAITNSLTHATLLAKYDKTQISILPGKLHKQQLFLYGAETVKKIEEYQVDYTILGIFAISKEGLFIHTEEEGLVKRQMIAQGQKVIALADHTKINTTGFFKICSLADIDILVTDEPLEKAFMQKLEENDVDVVIIAE